MVAATTSSRALALVGTFAVLFVFLFVFVFCSVCFVCFVLGDDGDGDGDRDWMRTRTRTRTDDVRCMHASASASTLLVVSRAANAPCTRTSVCGRTDVFVWERVDQKCETERTTFGCVQVRVCMYANVCMFAGMRWRGQDGSVGGGELCVLH